MSSTSSLASTNSWPSIVRRQVWPEAGIRYSYDDRYIKTEKLQRWLNHAFGSGNAKYIVSCILNCVFFFLFCSCSCLYEVEEPVWVFFLLVRMSPGSVGRSQHAVSCDGGAERNGGSGLGQGLTKPNCRLPVLAAVASCSNAPGPCSFSYQISPKFLLTNTGTLSGSELIRLICFLFTVDIFGTFFRGFTRS
jgi:nucleoside recognition membrane protein YjiH